MQINWLSCVILLGLIVESAAAETPFAPSAKPLTGGVQEAFIEGVDVPASKPQRRVEPLQPKSESRAQIQSCELSEALFVHSPAIVGENGCGFERAVKMIGIENSSEDTVRFAGSVTISCEFAKTLTQWLVEDVIPASRTHLDSELVEVATGPGYQCRRRNNKPDGKLSEHALGTAVDISNFKFASGDQVSIEGSWGKDTRESRFLQAIHGAACKRFTTVLGPDADPNHKSHFHLDIGCHGVDCTYLICQ
ncbi:MAG: extensin family protein [Roseibium sp.]